METQASETYPLGSALEATVVDLFRSRTSSIIFIEGKRESGKTDFSLLNAEILSEFHIIHRFATNIKISEAPFQYERITNLEDLTNWLTGTNERKLYILDEAGKAIRRRTPMAKQNIDILDMIQVIRHYRANLIFIAPNEKYIDSAMLGTDVLDVRVLKPNFKNPKIALWLDLMEGTRIDFNNIPKTSVAYDDHDIAPFTKMKPKEQPLNEDDALIDRWSNGATAESLGIHTWQLNRKVRKWCREKLKLVTTCHI